MKRDLWQLLKTPRLLPTTVAHGLIEAPYFLFPPLLLLIQAQFGLNDWQIGLLGSGPMLLAGIMAPLAGVLGDRIRKTSVITLALGLSGLGSALIGLFGDTLLILATGLGLLGFTSALYHPAGFGVISQDTAKNNRKSRMFAIHGVGGSLGAGIGPLSIGFLLPRLSYSWQKVYLVWTFPMLCYTLVYQILIRPYETDSTLRSDFICEKRLQPPQQLINIPVQRNPPRIMTRGLFIIVTFMALLALGRGSLSFFLPAFLAESKKIPIAEAAVIYSISPLFGIFGQLAGGALADKTSEKIIIEVVLLAQVLIFLAIYVTEMGLVLLGIFCVLGIVTSALWPATASLTASSSTEKNRGAAYGIYMAPQTVLGAIAPIIGGLLKGISYLWLFGFATILGLIGVITMHLYSEKTAMMPLRKS